MKSVDMNTVEFLSSTKYNLIDQFSKGDNEPPYDTDIGGTYDLKNIQYSADSSGITTIKYTRAYNTGDKYDYVVKPDSSLTISLAWNSGTINDHHNNFKITSVTINSSNPVVSAAPATPVPTPVASPTATPATTPSIPIPTDTLITNPVDVPSTPVAVPTTPVAVPMEGSSSTTTNTSPKFVAKK